MSVIVLLCGKLFDGISKKPIGPAEILIEGNKIMRIRTSGERPVIPMRTFAPLCRSIL